jgi:peptidyl-prolyl cis-trans isomerase C
MMPMIRSISVLLTLGFVFAPATQAQVRDNPELLAARGDGEVSHADFEARVNRIPPEVRFRVVRDTSRMDEILNSMLINAQLAAAAEEAGFQDDPVVQNRIQLAIREELARAWIEHVIDNAEPADFTAMAREQYTLNRERFMTPETIDVAHILINLEDRTDAEALELAESLREQVIGDPDRFGELARSFSDDAGSRSRGGVYNGVKKGDMVEPFENAAFALEVGQISVPVKTRFGYHVIRLDAVHAPEPVPFETVQAQLEEQMRDQHRERVRGQYLTPLYEEDIEVSRESVQNSILRVFGPEVLADFTGESESQ